MLIDILKDLTWLRGRGLLELLLRDRTTGTNIRWATDIYTQLGEGFGPDDEIPASAIACGQIKPHACRERAECAERTRLHAEVVTPLRVVKQMCDCADERWCGWERALEHMDWKRYVMLPRMEIACGEAPFLATRYAPETGEVIPVEERVGLLDRKLFAVSAHATDVEEWKNWAMRAVQSIYGYELQGDNLLIARINVLCTVTEHLHHRWGTEPGKAWLEALCDVINWNLWQMDGIRGCPPAQSFAESAETDDLSCRTFDWNSGTSVRYSTLREARRESIAFDVLVGNPPYQAAPIGTNKGFAPPIYHLFLDEAFSLADRAVLIHPARFLFRAGSTPKAWNEKMLNDPHFKVLHYERDATTAFPDTDIKGGVAITCYDKQQQFDAIGLFSHTPS
jgi:type II restriction enzyme